MTLDQFTFFAAVAKHLNLTKAAQELHVSQPSISQQLKSLEQRYGTRLYRRIGRGIELTDAGHLFLKNVTPLLEQANKLDFLFKGQNETIQHEFLRVGGTFLPSVDLLPLLLARFKKSHPDINVALETQSPERVERLILNSGAEIGVTTRVPRSTELERESFRREKVVLFVCAAHPLAKKRRVTVADILATPLIIRGGKGTDGTTERLLKQFADHGLEFKVGMRCSAAYVIKAAVKRNMGVGIAFEEIVKAEAKQGEFKILNGHGLKLEGEVFIIYPKDKPLSPPAREFLDLLRRSRPKEKALQNTNSDADLQSSQRVWTRYPVNRFKAFNRVSLAADSVRRGG